MPVPSSGLYVSYGLMETHKLRIGKVRARDQAADYWLQVAFTVSTCKRTHTQGVTAFGQGALKRELIAPVEQCECGGVCLSSQMNDM